MRRSSTGDRLTRRSLMVQDAKNKITFLKMELLRQSKQGQLKINVPTDVATFTRPPQLDAAQATTVQRKAALLHKIDVEYRIAAASTKLMDSAKNSKAGHR